MKARFDHYKYSTNTCIAMGIINAIRFSAAKQLIQIQKYIIF